MKELQYIQDILVDINNGNLEINFICKNEINKDELQEFYFIGKVFKAINAFCEKVNLNPRVLFNNYKWEAFYDMSETSYINV